MISCGINGFGRFGMHLLRYWLLNIHEANFTIDYINDDGLSIAKVADIIEHDPYLDLHEHVRISGSSLVITKNAIQHLITFTHTPIQDIPWLGQPDIFLECSGKHTDRRDWSEVLCRNTKQVIISATSWTASQILVYGYNHDTFDSKPVISYGSCTVNAYIPLADSIHKKFGVLDSDVSVIHNVPHHQLSTSQTLQRKNCTLETVAPHLLSFLANDNFKVTYTLVPFSGVSMIDFRFRLDSTTNSKDFLAFLQNEIHKGKLRKLYATVPKDEGPSGHKFTSHSAVIIESSVEVLNQNAYIQAYFDNENSVNRFYDLTQYISKEIEHE